MYLQPFRFYLFYQITAYIFSIYVCFNFHEMKTALFKIGFDNGNIYYLNLNIKSFPNCFLLEAWTALKTVYLTVKYIIVYIQINTFL